MKFMTNNDTTKRRLPFSGDGNEYGGGGDDDDGYAGDGNGDGGRESLCMCSACFVRFPNTAVLVTDSVSLFLHD